MNDTYKWPETWEVFIPCAITSSNEHGSVIPWSEHVKLKVRALNPNEAVEIVSRVLQRLVSDETCLLESDE